MDGAAVTAYVESKAESNLVEVVVTEDETAEEGYTVNVTSESDQEMVVEVTVKKDSSSTEATSKE
jgi:hypothetical protein